MAAAYVVALQLILLPLTVAASNAPSAPLCSQLSDPAKSAPLKSDTGCACAAGCGVQCCAPGYPVPSSAAVSLQRGQGDVLAPAQVFLAFTLGQERGPHNPRAPPAA
ncbi:hypothetical protein DXH78_15080 [Undibacter mobilis]|uniref:Uncharacterized protein n=1 Tax=Undibacter mobilis TaxID=2292256 RepID=A0A371B325_9BRAD|nr:hypothetical protein DXH78_15080 [Undibacter mobilis]